MQKTAVLNVLQSTADVRSFFGSLMIPPFTGSGLANIKPHNTRKNIIGKEGKWLAS